eukprot:6978445-Prymnesium_polylepis.1
MDKLHLSEQPWRTGTSWCRWVPAAVQQTTDDVCTRTKHPQSSKSQKYGKSPKAATNPERQHNTEKQTLNRRHRNSCVTEFPNRGRQNALRCSYQPGDCSER